jgi:ribosome-associated protein YbcJ (S4-like RNA binding protein)
VNCEQIRIEDALRKAQARWTVVFHGTDGEARTVLGRARVAADYRRENRRVAKLRALLARTP